MQQVKKCTSIYTKFVGCSYSQRMGLLQPMRIDRRYSVVDMSVVTKSRSKPAYKCPELGLQEGLLLMRSYLVSHDESYDPSLEVKIYIICFLSLSF